MNITFDPDFDSGSWPGPLGERAASGGEEWLGPAGLLARLELGLGIGGPVLPAAERAAALARRVATTDGFWSASAELDPIGVARRLLAWRDELALGGWRRPAATDPARLRQLWEVTEGAPPGVADRLAAVVGALATRAIDLERITARCALSELEPAWRQALTALGARGVSVEARADARDARPSSELDLHAAGRPGFAPRGDGSLRLLRPYGPLAAADAVAAWLAAHGTASTVVVTPDAVLDAALRRHGVPTTGAALPAREDLLLQVLPLVAALAWSPPDPQRALELLTLPVGPVPPALARRLAEALHEWPAVGSDAWDAALAAGVAEIEDPARRQRVAARLERLFRATVPYAEPYPAAELRARLDTLEQWLRARAARTASDAERAPWQPALDQVASARRLLAAAGFETLTAAQLHWLLEGATEAADAPVPCASEAGLAAVGAPGGVAGPARVVVWWGFTLDAAPPVPALPLTAGERRALLAAGVALRDPGREALRRAARWRRPLHAAAERLLLVAPRRAANGDEAFPHPFWDEVLAGLADAALRARLEVGELELDPATPRRLGVARAAPAPRRAWQARAGLLTPRPEESPTSLQSLLGCSFQWAVEHAARLRPGATRALPANARLAGKLAHEILNRVLRTPFLASSVARREAEELFDRLGPRLAAPLFLPGADDPKHEARHAIALSAEALAQVLAGNGLRVLAAEQDLVCTHGRWKGRLRGRPDLVVGSPPAVLDLKWGGDKMRRRALDAGTALQLAAYAVLVRETPRAPLPDVAYFLLKTQRLLTTSSRFHDAERVATRHGVQETWTYFEAAFALAERALHDGRLAAPGNPDEAGDILPDEDDVDLDGRLVVAPGCGFCELQALCGRAFLAESGAVA